MKKILCAVATLVAVLPAMGQKYEFGVAGGGSFHQSKTVNSASTAADAGFENGFAVSVNLGNDMYSHVGGEVRYTFQQHDMKLSSGGTKATFGAQSHAIHYDFLIHATPRGSNVRPYVAFGGGAKIYRGTGTEQPFQPLGNIAVFTKTQEVAGMGSVGAGVKFRLTDRTIFRVDVHDYLSPFPKDVLTPVPPNGKISGWINNIVAMAGISFTF
jgi:opacity protein-like surface antigen